jgi:hypothetical protein
MKEGYDMAFDLTFLQSEQTFIPFLFVLALVFGVLEITHIFRNKAINAVIALAMAFFTVSNSTFISLLWSQFGNITSFFIVMFFLSFILETFGLRGKNQIDRGEEGIFINGAILAIVLGIGYAKASLLPEIPYIGSGTNLIILVSLVFIMVIFWTAFRIGREEAPSAPQKRQVQIPLYSKTGNVLL